MSIATLKKLGLLVIILAVVVLFFKTGIHTRLTLEGLKASQAEFQTYFATNPVKAIGIFAAIYIPFVALNLPGAVLLGLLAGALFGSIAGTVVTSFLSTISATLACALSRYLFRDFVQATVGTKLRRVHMGMEREGAFYLFSMRLIPLIPFVGINMLMGLTSMPLRTFYLISQIGMLPGTFVFVNAGSQLGKLDSLSGIFSPSLIVSFALLGIFPLVTKRLLDMYRRKVKGVCSMADEANLIRLENGDPDYIPSAALLDTVRAVSSGCTECMACVKQCAFLNAHGTPKSIADAHGTEAPGTDEAVKAARIARDRAYECSLCGLCTAVCPEKIDPAAMFLNMRRGACEAGEADIPRYKTILGYEKKGNSALFSYYSLPEGCDTVFFPGCTLPGTRPGVTRQLFDHMRASLPTLGIVLDCCNKPSHDLGRQDHFDRMFGEMREWLSSQGVQRVLVACPNCHKVFKQYGGPITVETVYEFMDSHGLPDMPQVEGEVTIHDPCPLRNEPAIQKAVRAITSAKGLEVSEMRHKQGRTLCCGEGGSVGFRKPAFAQAWGQMRHDEAKGRKIITFCAGCANFLSRHVDVGHVLDLTFRPQDVMEGTVKLVKAPFTYLERLKLKKALKALPAAVTRERTFSPEQAAQAAADACTKEERAVILRKKGVGLAAVFVLSVALFFLVQKFFYILDAYIYTAEFHVMFWEHNMRAASIPLFAEYLHSLGAFGGLPHLVAAYLQQNVLHPFAGSVLPMASVAAFGAVSGGLSNAIALFLTGTLGFMVGKFLLGDILPIARGTRAPVSGRIAPAIAVAIALPLVPVLLAAVAGAALRVRTRTFLMLLIPAILIRIVIAVL